MSLLFDVRPVASAQEPSDIYSYSEKITKWEILAFKVSTEVEFIRQSL